jgi:hypothetical protein
MAGERLRGRREIYTAYRVRMQITNPAMRRARLRRKLKMLSRTGVGISLGSTDFVAATVFTYSKNSRSRGG